MSSEKPEKESFGEQVQNNWAVLLLIWTVATVGITWTVAEKVVVGPKESRITELQKQLDYEKSKPVVNSSPKVPEDPLVLHETPVFERSSVTSTDGVCEVLVDSIVGESARFVITVGSGSPVRSGYISPGDRLRAGNYFVDLHRIRGNVADVSIYKQPQP